MVSSDSLFSSPIQSPNLNFMNSMSYNHFSNVVPKEEVGVVRGKEEEIESGSGSGPLEGGSGEEQENEQKPKKKRYHRHTARQIQEMEALFKECPHPDEKQRMKLSQELGLKPRQVKFWFQNRRTQMKAQQDRSDNVILRAENESLKNENFRLQAAIRNVMCPTCGGPAILGEVSLDEQHLRLENARLKDELEQLSVITSRLSGRPLQNCVGATASNASLMGPSLDLDMGVYSRHFNDPLRSGACPDLVQGSAPMQPDQNHLPFAGGGLMEHEKPIAIELAVTAMEELVRMSRTNEPLWMANGNGAAEMLDLLVYTKMFASAWPMSLKSSHSEFRTEATRHTALIFINSITLVDAFLDAEKWMELFPSIVSKAKTIQIITPGVSGHGSGSLQLIYAELQVLSPLVPTREAYFLRYCQQNVEEGSWVIVDFPIDSFHETPNFPNYRRRPSGCVIQDMPNGYSKVTWVEHGDVEDKAVHQIFDQFVNSRMAFGAHRWLAILQRQCERLASLMARNISDLGVIPTPEARRNMMRLAQRMMKAFCVNISTSGGQSWTALSDSADDTTRITTRKSMEPGQPHGIILTAVSTTWLPFSHDQVFDLLRDENRRSQLDVLSSGSSLQEVAHIANGSHPGNCISLFRVNGASNSSQHVELILQESCTDPSGSLVVYATVDVNAVQQVVMSGEDSSYIPLLPIGFVVQPATTNTSNIIPAPDDSNRRDSGSLLTVGLQVLASAIPTAKLNLSSVSAINNHICNAVQQISAALGGATSSGLCVEPAGLSEH